MSGHFRPTYNNKNDNNGNGDNDDDCDKDSDYNYAYDDNLNDSVAVPTSKQQQQFNRQPFTPKLQSNYFEQEDYDNKEDHVRVLFIYVCNGFACNCIAEQSFGSTNPTYGRE